MSEHERRAVVDGVPVAVKRPQQGRRPEPHGVRITMNTGTVPVVLVDGVDVAMHLLGFTVLAVPGRGPKVLLELQPAAYSLESDVAAVEVDGATEDVLKRLGWTPPAAPKPPVAQKSTDVQD